MSKVMGIIMTLAGLFISVYSYFLALNSNWNLAYNPEEKLKSLSAVGLTMPLVVGSLLFIAGVTFLIVAREDNSETRA